MSNKVSIIILAWNGFAYNQMCLRSIEKYTDFPYELVLVDNGSSDGTGWLFKHTPGAKVITNQKNLGFAAGNNQGIKVSEGDYVLLLNNDTVVTAGWLSNLVACLKSSPDIGAVGPRSNYAAVTGMNDLVFKDFTQMHEFAREFNRPDPAKWVEVEDWLPGFCLLLKREVINRVGFLDERFELGTLEDVDYCRRIRKAGYRLVCAGDTFICHFGSRTFMENNIDIQKVWQENVGKFYEKWGFVKPES